MGEEGKGTGRCVTLGRLLAGTGVPDGGNPVPWFGDPLKRLRRVTPWLLPAPEVSTGG